jgi:D-glycero-D-manno-heptose 1,7-bisphosphate phosphatase
MNVKEDRDVDRVSSARALFLDRDGILNKAIRRNGRISSPWSIGEFEIIHKASELVNAAKKKNYIVIVVTNQPDVARGNMTMTDLEAMNRLVRESFFIDDLGMCTSADDSDFRRKPNPGMILEMAEKWGITLGDSFFLGDGEKDIIAGKRAGVKTILLQNSDNQSIHGTADYNCSSYAEVSRLL